MRSYCLSITVVIIVMALGSPAMAQSTPPDTSQSTSQYFTLNLPAGVSLISSPLDTGTGLAVNTFLGLPAGWPLFFGWDSDTQSWVPPDQTPAGLGHGFWTYLPTPTMLAVAGQPFNFLTSVTEHAPPGWHLFGVPYLSGINWQDFKVYLSGNPIGLDTAMANGWIDSNIATMQGTDESVLSSGQPFAPGAAYWVHTTVPLDVRADAAPAASTTTGNTAPGSTPLTGTTAGGESAGSSAVGWMAAISETLGYASEGAAAFAEGNVFAGGFYMLTGGFDLLEYALGSGPTNSESSELTQVDGELETLLDDVTAVSNQLSSVEEAVTGLEGWVQSESALGQPMANAETWLLNNYNNPHSPQSREFARWQLAGCPATATSCPEASNPVTEASLKNYQSEYVTQKGNPTITTDFPLWWAESVLGGFTTETFKDGGQSAASYVTEIYQGLTEGLTNTGTTAVNGLVAYMQYVISQSAGCGTDITDTNHGGACDLYGQVYTPVEAFFSQAMADQAQLVAAIVESYGVMTEEGLAPGSFAQTYMTGVAQEINKEAEAFLRVAEQIALYRAADGVQDWGSFPSSDAGQFLARADFVVSQVAGQYYQTNPQAGWFNPPWPALGTTSSQTPSYLVGRVFYPHGQTRLAAGSTRGVCVASGPGAQGPTGGAFCESPVAQISESTAPGQVTGPWPYFLWTASGTTAQGTTYFDWTVQRINPTTGLGIWAAGPYPLLADTAYLVNSVQPGSATTGAKSRGAAPVFIGAYDQNYVEGNGSYLFASLSSVDGIVGPYGLDFPQGTWAWSGGGNDKAHTSSVSYGDPNCTLTVNYINDAGDSNSPRSFSWSESQQLQFTMPNNYAHVKVIWPAYVSLSLGAAATGNFSSDAKPYWQSLTFDQQLEDSHGNAVTNGDNSQAPCGTNFFYCKSYSAYQNFYSSPLQITGNQYTLKASFNDSVVPTTLILAGQLMLDVGANPTGNSSVTWTLTMPSLTITK